MHVLRNMVSAVRPGGLVLDLQVIRPNPVVEADGEELSEVDGEPLFALADAAARRVSAGRVRGKETTGHAHRYGRDLP